MAWASKGKMSQAHICFKRPSMLKHAFYTRSSIAPLLLLYLYFSELNITLQRCQSLHVRYAFDTFLVWLPDCKCLQTYLNHLCSFIFCPTPFPCSCTGESSPRRGCCSSRQPAAPAAFPAALFAPNDDAPAPSIPVVPPTSTPSAAPCRSSWDTTSPKSWGPWRRCGKEAEWMIDVLLLNLSYMKSSKWHLHQGSSTHTHTHTHTQQRKTDIGNYTAFYF